MNQRGLNIIIAVVIFAVVIGGLAVGLKSYFKKDVLVGTNTNQVATNTSDTNETVTNSTANTNTTTDETAGWQTYTAANYSVKHPIGWKVNHNDVNQNGLIAQTDFTPPEIRGDFLWGIWEYDASQVSIDSLAKQQGKQFETRQETREQITINGISATKVTVLSGMTDPVYDDWKSIDIYIAHGDSLIVISNGAVQTYPFDDFFQTLSFID